MKPIAVQDCIVIKQMEAEETTKGGIVLPNPNKPKRGQVIAVGPGKFSDSGVLIPMQVKVGNVVHFGERAIEGRYGEDEEEFVIMREPDVLFIEGAD